ncbi:hypothetical protein A0257_04490 [Hymenobacter psoromatis]|nr:hypothetical protein A0257_04490 [Hymenobacter psoromatis]
MSLSVSSQPKRLATKEIQVLTNQLHIGLPADWSALLRKYSIWCYRLSETQNRFRRFADARFYSRFTNDYKNKFDQPFYFFTFDEPCAALYTLLPADEVPRPWLYSFGKPQEVQPEEIIAESISPDELKPHVLLKLMLALCFYENGSNDKDRRVCQSKFYLRVKGQPSGKFLTAVEIQPVVEEQPGTYTLTLKVEANTFERIEPAQASNSAHLGAFFELFESQGHTYLRQLRPSQVATFTRELYQQRTFPGKHTQADWHHNGSLKHPQQYQESRSYQVRHVQERLSSFLGRYGFRVALAEETMQRQKPSPETLPLHRLPVVQVVDNRLNPTAVPIDDYLTWLNGHQFRQGKTAHALAFELVAAAKVDAARPVLALLDADRPAFETTDRQLALLALAGYQDPYRILYQNLPAVVKQSLNVNPNEVEEYTVAADFLAYASPISPPAQPPVADEAVTEPTIMEPVATEPAPPESEAEKKARLHLARQVRQAKTLAIKLDVCLSELWLKWVIAGKAAAADGSPSLPLLADLPADWGFITNNWLLYFEQGDLQFADLDTLEGKQLLKARFAPWSEIRQRFLSRQPKYASLEPTDDKAKSALRKAHFVLVGRTTLEIEQTEAIALPNWPVIKLIKAAEPGASAKSLAALGVYAGGVWATPQGHRYLVSGASSSQLAEPRGHHLYQIHPYGPVSAAQLATLRALLTVTFVRHKQFTVWPYPFDLLRLHQEMVAK